MNTQQKYRRCFIIGPMKDMSRLIRLRDEIIKPLLAPYNFKVITPDEGSIGNIMKQILLNLEQADILIADLSGSNPNVMYELGVYHSFGKPYIVVKDKTKVDEAESTPFDIAEYRFRIIDFNDVEFSKAALKEPLDNIVFQLDRRDWFGNPVTDFYQSPVAEIPTAVGLSKNYIKNFLRMVLPNVFQKDEKGKDYQLEVRIETADLDEQQQPQFRALTAEERRNLKFEMLIPQKLHFAHHGFISGLKELELLKLRSAEVGRRSRPFKMHYKVDEQGAYVLVDIPTILSTLYESIMQRRKLYADQFDSEDWEVLEAQELERFAIKCELFKKEMEETHPVCKAKLLVTWNWNPEEPGH